MIGDKKVIELCGAWVKDGELVVVAADAQEYWVAIPLLPPPNVSARLSGEDMLQPVAVRKMVFRATGRSRLGAVDSQLVVVHTFELAEIQEPEKPEWYGASRCG